MPPSTSALWVTRVPARVTGEVPPAMAIDKILMTERLLAAAIIISQHSLINFKGLTGQVVNDRIGRF
jgi:hypothetical protein